MVGANCRRVSTILGRFKAEIQAAGVVDDSAQQCTIPGAFGRTYRYGATHHQSTFALKFRCARRRVLCGVEAIG